MTRIGFLFFVFSISACSGLPIEDRYGVKHYVVLGFGIISVSQQSKPGPAAEVIKATTLGFAISNQPGVRFNAGYASNTVVLVPVDAENVVIEVADSFLGPTIINKGGLVD